MIPFLLAAVPITHLPASPAQPSAVQPSHPWGTLIAAQPSSSTEAVCPAPSQANAQTNANSGITRAAGNNFNLVDITRLLPTGLASRPTGQSLNIPLTTSGFTSNSTNSSNSGSTNTPPSCSSRTTLLAVASAITAGSLAATPGQAGLGFGLAGSTIAEALFDPSGSSDTELSDLLGENGDYSLSAYHKGSGFNRRLNGWLTLETSPSSISALRGKSSSDSYLVGSITLTFNDVAGDKEQGVDYPIVHLANLGGGGLQASNGSSVGSLSSQLRLSKINGAAAPSNAVVRLSGRNLAVADNLLSNSAANTATSKAFGSAIIKGEGIRSLTFDVYVKADGTSPGSSFPDSLSSGQDRFFLSLTSGKEAPLAYGYGSLQAGVGFPGVYSGTIRNPILPPPIVAINTLDLNSGFNGELAAGYRGQSFRSDLSIGYSNFANQLQTVNLSSPFLSPVTASTPGVGNVSLFTVMANGYLDFKIRNRYGAISRWSPYLGAGIGLGILNSPGCSLPNCTLFDSGSDSGIAYQFKAGISYRTNETSRLFMELGYLGVTGISVGGGNSVNYDPLAIWRLNLGWRQSF